MGNEASLEGGEGPLSGLPEGLAPDGKGGFVRVPGGTPVDLSELSEEQRKQLTAAMSRAQGRQPGGTAAARRPSESDAQQRPQQVGASRGPTGLSKSRTVDAFNQGPVGKPSPGRSPSSLSLFESRFRQDPKDPDTKSSGMFGSSFLSGANPLSAMTSSVSSSISSMGDSVNIPKFGLFGDEEEGDGSSTPDAKQGGKPPAKVPQQGPGPKGPQQGGPQKQGHGPPGQGPKPGQGPTGQGPKPGQGPPGQGPRQGQGPAGQGPKSGQGPPGQGPPGQQTPRPGQAPPGQGGKQGGPPQQKGGPPPQGPGKPGPKQQGPPGPGAQPREPAKSGGPAAQQGAGKSGGALCPLCKTTQMNIGSKEPSNYNNCTECKNQVCSLCGFSPPDSAGKEWLCLNCQMQRAMGGMDPPGMTKPKQGSAPPSPQRQAPGKPGKLLIKQQSTTDQGLTPPTTPRQKSPGPTSPGPLSPSSSMTGSPKIDPKTGRPIQQKSSPQQSPAKPKQESSFFGGLGGISLGGLTDTPKSPAGASQNSESVTGKLFGGFGGLMESSKPQAQSTTKQEESVAGKLFGGFGGLTESTKSPAAASQMFSFGSSLLSSATNLVTGEDDKAADTPPGSPPDSEPDSGPGSPPDSPFSGPGSPPDSESAPDTPPAKSKKSPRSISVEQEEKAAEAKSTPASTCAAKESCPLCKVELNVGSTDTPNYSLCTECKKTVCNLCGFNPTPHLGEKEWLCLNCQTQRAMSGQLGDTSPPAMASPKKEPPAPVPPTTPTPASVDSKPLVEAPAPDTKVVPTTTPTSDNPSVKSPPIISPEETQSNEQKQTLQQESPVSESVVESIPEISGVQQQQSSSEKVEDCPNPETESANAEQQMQSVNVNEIPAVEQEQCSSGNKEDHPNLETEPSNADQQMKTATVSDISGVQEQQNLSEKIKDSHNPEIEESCNADQKTQCTISADVQGQQNSSEKATEDHPLPMKIEEKNLLNAALDNTILTETEPNPKISQVEAAAPSKDNEKAEATPENLLEVIANSDEPKPASVPEVATQEVNIQPCPVLDHIATNVKEDKVLERELIQTNEKPQIDKPQVNPPGQTQADTAVNVDNAMSSKHEPETLASDSKNEINAEMKTQLEPTTEKTETTENAPHLPPQADESLNPVVPVEKHEILKSDEKVNENVIVEGETTKQEILQNCTVETTVQVKPVRDIVEGEALGFETTDKSSIDRTGGKDRSHDGKGFEKDGALMNAGTEKVTEVTAVERRAIEEKETKQITVEENNQALPGEKVDKVESSPVPSLSKTEDISPVIEKIDAEVLGEEVTTIKTDELSSRPEEKVKPGLEADISALNVEKLTPTHAVLKAEDESEKAEVGGVLTSPDSNRQEQVNVKEPIQSLNVLSLSAVSSQTQVTHQICEEKLIHGEADSGSQNENSTVESQHEVKKDLTPTGCDEKQPKNVTEQKPSLTENHGTCDKEVVESQFVAGSIEESISASEPNIACDKNSSADFDVEDNTESKNVEIPKTVTENGGVSVLDASAPVEKPDPPVFKQDSGSNKENTNMEEKVEDKPLVKIKMQ